MIVCERCLQAIEAHEWKQIHRRLEFGMDDHLLVKGYFDRELESFVPEDDYDGDDADELVHCEWCDEHFPLEEMVEI